MSFVEDNKTWVLPLLGLGTAAVIWLNVRTFNQDPLPAQEPPAPLDTATPSPQATAPVPSAPAQDEALWDDLRPVAFVPAELELRAPLEQRALLPLPPQAFLAASIPAVPRPRGQEPAQEARLAPVSGGGTPLPPPPADFLIEGPGGTQAWFEGHGYHTGQTLRGQPFTVQGIRILPTPRVTLQGTSSAPRPTRTTRPTPVQEVP